MGKISNKTTNRSDALYLLLKVFYVYLSKIYIAAEISKKETEFCAWASHFIMNYKITVKYMHITVKYMHITMFDILIWIEILYKYRLSKEYNRIFSINNTQSCELNTFRMPNMQVMCPCYVRRHIKVMLH